MSDPDWYEEGDGNMFDVRSALLAISGISFNSVELRRAFENILFQNIQDIPAEFRARDMFELAWNNGWLKEIDGLYTVDIS